MGTLLNVELPPGFVSVTTIKVITRHSEACQAKHPDWGQNDNTCSCCKHNYIYENGKDNTYSAKTRSLERAKQLVREEEDRRDPIKLRLRQIEEEQAAKEAAEASAELAKKLSVTDGTERWEKFKAKKAKRTGTKVARQTAANRIRSWASDNGIENVSEITFEKLDAWRNQWEKHAEKIYDRIVTAAQAQFQGYLKSFCRYMVRLGALGKDPSADLDPISIDSEPARPLEPSQFQALLDSVALFCADHEGILQGMESEIRAQLQLQRWAGLRLGDTLLFSRASLVGNRITLTTEKTRAHIQGRVIPDSVAAELAALPERRPGFRTGYFFWLKGYKSPQSLKAFWVRIHRLLNNYVHLVDDRGKPMRFHSHMLRDTFAVQLLLRGVSLEEVSKLLTHSSIQVTERHYAPWVKSRMDKLERELVAAMQGMGQTVTR